MITRSSSEVLNETRIVSSRVLPMPKRRDKGENMAMNLGRKRRHRKNWDTPTDASVILDMHFSVQNPARGQYYAEMSIEFPVKGGFDTYTVVRTGKTREQALRAVIEEYQNSEWFHLFKTQGVYFYVTGAGMEQLYRGYL